MPIPQKIDLPYPPSANHRLIQGKGRTFKTPAYRAYEWATMALFSEAKLKKYPKGAKLGIKLEVHPPDLRIRDLDGALKCTLDAFQIRKGGIVADDFDFWELHVFRGELTDNGKIACTIWELS